MKKEWQKALLTFDNQVIELAVETCLHRYEIPPTLPQFIEMCRKIKNPTVFFKALPSCKEETARAKDVAKANLDEIKNLLQGLSTLSLETSKSYINGLKIIDQNRTNQPVA